METQIDYWEAHALLEWQVELGVSEAIGETPVNRYEAPQVMPKPAAAAASDTPPAPVKAPEIDAADVAQKAVSGVASIDELQSALAAFELCELRRGARNLVFQDGLVGARVMVIGDTPTRDDDIAGKPFTGPTGALFDKMFGAIDLSRTAQETGQDAAQGIYATMALPWRPPENRDPSAKEIAMLKPFLMKHIELANPDFIVLMGNAACLSVLGRAGITRLRGKWQTVLGKPALPMMSPRDLLRTPIAKREAWADLLDLHARLSAAP